MLQGKVKFVETCKIGCLSLLYNPQAVTDEMTFDEKWILQEAVQI